ncbi:Reverse transcriptase (RNA-dependent DNA polymerase) [Fragilaria crotonensis]|nr:Reverse transcriptase (RNA-dependent DNA polymerase) [Fragilaria crotonensis]
MFAAETLCSYCQSPRGRLYGVQSGQPADRKDEIDDLLRSIDEKIGDNKTNEEVAGELGNDQLPRNDAEIDEAEENALKRSDADEYTPEAFDKYLAAEIVTDRGGELLRGSVKSRKRDSDGKPIGSANPNSLLDTREYFICFEDGTEETYTTNLIAECLYSLIDDQGRRLQVMKEIIDHDKGQNALSKEDSYYSSKAGPKPKRTMRGWRLLVEWDDSSSSWISLADLKDLYPVQVADYAVLNNLRQEPAFRWWVPFVLKKRERILKSPKIGPPRISAYGLELPKSVVHALEIDKRTGTDFWKKAIEKEIRNVFPAFKFIKGDDTKVPPELRGLLILDATE